MLSLVCLKEEPSPTFRDELTEGNLLIHSQFILNNSGRQSLISGKVMYRLQIRGDVITNIFGRGPKVISLLIVLSLLLITDTQIILSSFANKFLEVANDIRFGLKFGCCNLK
jgi:hypothetical protein